MATHANDEQTAAQFNAPSASFLKRAGELDTIADQFISEQQPWMAEGYQILAGMYRRTAEAVAAQEAS